MDELLEEIMHQRHIHQNEINYIGKLIQRACVFFINNEERDPDAEADNEGNDVAEHQPTKRYYDKYHHAMLGNETNETAVTALHGEESIHMNHIINTIDMSNDKIMVFQIIRCINSSEYDTESVIDDLCGGSDNQVMYDINTILTSNWSANTSYFQSKLLRTKLFHSNEIIDDQCSGLTFNLLCDIYNVHKCFLFANYQFKRYDINQFVKNIQTCKQLSMSKECIENIGVEDAMTTMNLYPSYII
eukprot:60436_1